MVSAATVVGLLWPSPVLAARVDLILAALVAAVALTIDPRSLRALAQHRGRVASAALLPLVTLLPLAIGLAAAFGTPEREGLFALGLSSSEVASAALVGVAGGAIEPALAIIVVSLGLTALVAPLLAPVIVGAAVSPATLTVRFSLVVVVPLAAGLALRTRRSDAKVAAGAERALAPILALLLYASLGDLPSMAKFGHSGLAALAFLGGSLGIGLMVARPLGGLRAGVIPFAARDFAVAAALAVRFGAPGAAATTAAYGVFMLLAATAAASLLRRRRRVLGPADR